MQLFDRRTYTVTQQPHWR